MRETDYYIHIKNALVAQLKSNFNTHFRVTALQGEFHQGLEEFCKNNDNISPTLQNYSQNALKLHLDVFVLIENLQTRNFELVIVEIKKTKSLGLINLSQLIGYCIVANVNYGLLINVDNRISGEFAHILTKTPALTQIERIHNQQRVALGLGIMTYNHNTRHIEASDYGYFKMLSQLANAIEKKLE